MNNEIMILPLKILHHYQEEMTYLNSRLTFRLILARAEAAVIERSGLDCGGENKEEKVQGIQMSLDLLFLLHQDKNEQKKSQKKKIIPKNDLSLCIIYDTSSYKSAFNFSVYTVLGATPTCLSATSPPLKINTVGMFLTPYLAANS